MACDCQKELPSPAQMAVNAGRAVTRIVSAVVQSKPVKVSPEIFTARVAVCRTCPSVHVHRDGERLRCGECGCWLNGQHFAKASLATETCPLKKWGEA